MLHHGNQEAMIVLMHQFLYQRMQGFSDPFADSKGATFSYSVSGEFQEG